MADKKKKGSGSIKIDPDVYKKMADLCEKTGVKISFFATEAISEKLQKQGKKYVYLNQ